MVSKSGASGTEVTNHGSRPTPGPTAQPAQCRRDDARLRSSKSWKAGVRLPARCADDDRIAAVFRDRITRPTGRNRPLPAGTLPWVVMLRRRPSFFSNYDIFLIFQNISLENS